MAWIDRQTPQGDEIFYDHIGYFVPDLDAAGAQLEKLGFQVSGINTQYNENAAGELVLTGTSNKLVKLTRGFVEVLAATSQSALADQLKQMLARYQGLHVIALTHPDMDRTAARLSEVEIATQDVVRMRRKVTVRGEDTLMAYTILRVKPGAFPEGRLQILTNHTPENFWLSGEMDHPNGADRLTDLLICVEDVEDAVARYERFFGKRAVTMAGMRTLDLDRGRFHFVTPETANAMVPGFAPPALPYTAGQGLGTEDLNATKAYFRDAGIDPVCDGDNYFCIGPDDALGAYLLFHDNAVEAPWIALAERN
ncbi:MAG: VOC family protein [Rhodospirillaceae bacterium]|nr:VOC family protein [Rhodospirillaceae bacterium]